MSHVINIREEEAKLLEEWDQRRPGLIFDGVIDESVYSTCVPKVTFVLEQPRFGWKKTNDLCTFLAEGGDSGPFWNNLARWAYGFQNLERDLCWEEVDDLIWGFSRERAIESLKTVSVACLAKNTEPCDEETFYQIAMEDGDLLQRQLAIYQPDFVILCGEWASNAASTFLGDVAIRGRTKRGIIYGDFLSQRTCVCYERPDAPVASSVLFYGIYDAVSELALN